MATLKVIAPFSVELSPPILDPDRPVLAPQDVAPTVTPTIYTFPVAGTYEDVPDEVASHWYAQPFLEGYEGPEPTPGTDPTTIVMTPIPEEEPAGEGEAGAMSAEQKAHLRHQKAAEARAAKAAAKAEEQ
jgi:hypothetical protein